MATDKVVAASQRVLYVSMLCDPGTNQHSVCTRTGYVDDSRWFSDRVAEISSKRDTSHITIDKFDLVGDATAEFPDTEEYSHIVVGGTFNGVYDDKPWQRKLQLWLKRMRKLGKPLLGICGGHQAMSVVLGGKVETRKAGTSAGSVPITITDAGSNHFLFHGMDKNPTFHFANGDHVVVPPQGATVLAHIEGDSSYLALDYGDSWVSTQFHPEASHTFFQMLVSENIVKQTSPYLETTSGISLIDNFLQNENPS
eukprot:m.208321 g.208321  ORF g.208321 m.208321 type:complete len:254 (-) comp33003_c0_seq1:422-1183(-)